MHVERNDEWECVIELRNGGSIRCPAHPDDCDYVRVCDAGGEEVGYWTCDEWALEPEEVMGAILGAAFAPFPITRPDDDGLLGAP